MGRLDASSPVDIAHTGYSQFFSLFRARPFARRRRLRPLSHRRQPKPPRQPKALQASATTSPNTNGPICGQLVIRPCFCSLPIRDGAVSSSWWLSSRTICEPTSWCIADVHCSSARTPPQLPIESTPPWISLRVGLLGCFDYLAHPNPGQRLLPSPSTLTTPLVSVPGIIATPFPAHGAGVTDM